MTESFSRRRRRLRLLCLALGMGSLHLGATFGLMLWQTNTTNDQGSDLSFYPDDVTKRTSRPVLLNNENDPLQSPAFFPVQQPASKTAAAAQQHNKHKHNKQNNNNTIITFPFHPQPQYLGVLLDAGRHYFPVPWILRLLDLLSAMNYNLLHWRLSDDQAWAVDWGHASSSSSFYHNQQQPIRVPPPWSARNEPHYSRLDIRTVLRHAADRGITVVPEIDVPAHAGAWGPDWVVPCPQYVCAKGGFATPLNVNGPTQRKERLQELLRTVLQNVLDVFDQPPFLHLGGDEIDLTEACLQEAFANSTTTTGSSSNLQTYYQEFEALLQQVLADLAYPREQVVQWEVFSFDNRVPWLKRMTRASGITHYWVHHPKSEQHRRGRDDRTTPLPPYFVSTGLYFDTNKDQDAYAVFQKARATVAHQDYLPTAVIAGTFELSVDFWYDRNVVGKLLAVAMGVARRNHAAPVTAGQHQPPDVLRAWKYWCQDYLQLGSALCRTRGAGTKSFADFRPNLQAVKKEWNASICERATTTTVVETVRDRPSSTSSLGFLSWLRRIVWGGS